MIPRRSGSEVDLFERFFGSVQSAGSWQFLPAMLDGEDPNRIESGVEFVDNPVFALDNQLSAACERWRSVKFDSKLWK